MRHTLRRAAVVLILIVSVVPQTGCLAVAAAAGAGATVAYVRGDSESSVAGSPEQIAQAAEHTFADMGMVVISSRASASDSEVIARTARDVKVEVTARSHGESISSVAIRAGTFGDAALQTQVLDGIKIRLAPTAAGAADSATVDN